jgi:hypothetical protein
MRGFWHIIYIQQKKKMISNCVFYILGVLKRWSPKCSNRKKVIIVEIAIVAIGVTALILPNNGSSGSSMPFAKMFCGKRFSRITREIEEILQVLAINLEPMGVVMPNLPRIPELYSVEWSEVVEPLPTVPEGYPVE